MRKILVNAISAAMLISIVSYCNLVGGNSYVGAALFSSVAAGLLSGLDDFADFIGYREDE